MKKDYSQIVLGVIFVTLIVLGMYGLLFGDNHKNKTNEIIYDIDREPLYDYASEQDFVDSVISKGRQYKAQEYKELEVETSSHLDDSYNYGKVINKNILDYTGNLEYTINLIQATDNLKKIGDKNNIKDYCIDYVYEYNSLINKFRVHSFENESDMNCAYELFHIYYTLTGNLRNDGNNVYSYPLDNYTMMYVFENEGNPYMVASMKLKDTNSFVNVLSMCNTKKSDFDELISSLREAMNYAD